MHAAPTGRSSKGYNCSRICLLDTLPPESSSPAPVPHWNVLAQTQNETDMLCARQVQEYRGRPQLLAAGGAAWLVIRKKKAMRETYQKCPIGGISSASGHGDGGVDDEDPDPDDDSPPSGPDAGGGEADAVLPATDWEVQSSSANYTLSQVDQDR